MTRKVCVVTGSRAEYGLLRPILDAIRESSKLELQLVVTGMHLSPEFGLTYREIEADGHCIARRVEMLLSSDSPRGVAKSMGLGSIGFADALAELEPDVMLVVGDRFEILPAVGAAMVARIPIAHVHGGEVSEGAFDDQIRHAITKMSHLHFVATEAYRKRVIQMGEQPDRVFLVGGLGVDAIDREALLDRKELEQSLGIRFGERNILVTFHPVTLEASTSERHMTELLAALESLRDTQLLFTMPNADTDGRALFTMIEGFVARHPNAKAFTSLGQRRYLSTLQFVDAVVGNSSSGLAEVPTFKKGTVNIGDRQRGRLRAASVIDCAPDRSAIGKAIAELYSPAFQARLAGVKNPYGEPGAGKRITRVLEDAPIESMLKKTFYDIG